MFDGFRMSCRLFPYVACVRAWRPLNRILYSTIMSRSLVYAETGDTDLRVYKQMSGNLAQCKSLVAKAVAVGAKVWNSLNILGAAR